MRSESKSFFPGFSRISFSRSLPLLAIVFALVLLLAISPAAQAYENEEVNFLNLINQYRQTNGLPALQINQKLSNSSSVYDQILAQLAPSVVIFGETGCGHNCGNSYWVDRIRAAGYGYNTYLGENMAAGQSTAQQVFTDWKNSPGHNANMLDANYCAIGIDFLVAPGSTYSYYWTTDFGGVCEPQPQLDTTPPAVSIISPTGNLVSGIADFRANATDNVGVTHVEFYLDSVKVGEVTSAPYSYIWDVRALSGTHTLSAVAYDAAGNYGYSNTQVTINNFTPTKKYLFTWYDQSNGDWRDWVLMANPAGGAGTSRTAVLVGGLTYADRNIGVGAPAETPQFSTVIGGPVTVATTQPIITSQRVIYKQSFNEIGGVPENELTTTYYFTWYDSNTANGMVGDWILIGNQGNSAAIVQVYIGSLLKGTYTVPVGGRVTPSYPNTTDGPVKVVCTNGQPLIVSQRVLYKDSFSEVLGVPESKLSSSYSFTWYDDKPENFMRGNWILIGNQDVGTANVDVFIGPNKMGNYDVPQGGRITPQYQGVMNGPVRVVATNGKKLIVSQRILFKDSFEEFQGLTNPDFGTDLWFTWYDSLPGNGMNGNWILVANEGSSDAYVKINIGGVLKQQLVIPVGGNQPFSFSNTMNGPVEVVSTNGVPLMATQRVIYLNSFNEIGGIRLN